MQLYSIDSRLFTEDRKSNILFSEKEHKKIIDIIFGIGTVNLPKIKHLHKRFSKYKNVWPKKKIGLRDWEVKTLSKITFEKSQNSYKCFIYVTKILIYPWNAFFDSCNGFPGHLEIPTHEVTLIRFTRVPSLPPAPPACLSKDLLLIVDRFAFEDDALFFKSSV